MIRRRLLHAALAILPALTFSSAALAQHAGGDHVAPYEHGTAGDHATVTGSLTMDQLHEMLQDIPGDEFKQANQLKNEALHAVMMGAEPSVAEAKLKAFAAEYSRVAGSDPKMMEAHVLEAGAQLAAMAKDPTFVAHLSQLHADH